MNRSGVPLDAGSAGGEGMGCEKVSSGDGDVLGWGCGGEGLEGCEYGLRCRS